MKKRIGENGMRWRMDCLESRVMLSAAPVLPVATVWDTAVIAGAKTQTISVPVILSKLSSSVVKVNYSTMNVTALAGADYTAVGGTLTFAPGQWIKTVNVKVLKGRAGARDGAFNVVLTGAVNASFSTPGWWNYGRTAIRESVAAVRPTVTVANATALAGGTEVFHVTLSAASTAAVSLRYHTTDGTATAANYTAADGVLTIPAGSRTGTILVGTKAAGGPAAKSFTLLLASPANAELGSTAAFGKITYELPTLDVSDATVMEGDSGTSALTFTVTLSKASADTVTVNYATSDADSVGAGPGLVGDEPGVGTPGNFARAGSDYVATSGTLTFAPGQTSKTVSVTVNGDTQVERDEILDLNLSNASHATIATGTGVGTIDNDDVGSLSVGAASAAVVDGDTGDTVDFTVTLSSASPFPVTVHYATADGTAIAGTDYTTTSGTLTFNAGETSKVVSVPVSGNSVSPTETFELDLSNPTSATISTGTAVGTINAAEDLSDNLNGSNNGFDGADLIATNFHTGGTGVDLISVTLKPGSDPTSVKIYTDNSGHPGSVVGTLTAAGDGVFTASGITLSANTTYWVVNEGGGSQFTSGSGSGEGFLGGEVISLNGGSNWFAADGSLTFPMQVKTKFTGPGISIDSPSVSETVGANTTQTLTYTVTLSSAASFPVTVDYTTQDGTAAAGVDYTATNGTLTFAPGETTKTIDVTVTGNTLAADETFNLNLSNAGNSTISTATGVGTIASVGPVALSDNLAESPLGGGPLGFGQFDAQAFSTGSSNVTLVGVTIPVRTGFDMTNPDTSTYTLDVEIFSDASGAPGSSVGTLTVPVSYSSSTADVTFGGNGIALSANTNYWFVAKPVVGIFYWDVTTSTNGNGVGFNATAKTSSNSGASWDSFPYAYQMQVMAI